MALRKLTPDHGSFAEAVGEQVALVRAGLIGGYEDLTVVMPPRLDAYSGELGQAVVEHMKVLGDEPGVVFAGLQAVLWTERQTRLELAEMQLGLLHNLTRRERSRDGGLGAYEGGFLELMARSRNMSGDGDDLPRTSADMVAIVMETRGDLAKHQALLLDGWEYKALQTAGTVAEVEATMPDAVEGIVRHEAFGEFVVYTEAVYALDG